MKIAENVSLKQYNTFGIDVKAAYFAEVEKGTQLRTLIEADFQSKLILGGGSNILFTKDFDGLIIKNAFRGRRVLHAGDRYALVEIGGGENWHDFVLWCLKQNLGGVENLSLIPGTVGAAPIQNIGAYGVELKDVFHHLEAIDMMTGRQLEFDRKACEFAYRDSIFKRALKHRFFISRVYLTLTKGEHRVHTSYGAIRDVLKQNNNTTPTIRDISNAVIEIRSSKLPDPATLGNAGSFFKNPVIDPKQARSLLEAYPTMPQYPLEDGNVKIAAGWLIEKCGWKGKRVGETGAFEKQALVLVNYGQATGREIKHLADDITASVREKFGICLEQEVNVQ